MDNIVRKVKPYIEIAHTSERKHVKQSGNDILQTRRLVEIAGRGLKRLARAMETQLGSYVLAILEVDG